MNEPLTRSDACVVQAPSLDIDKWITALILQTVEEQKGSCVKTDADKAAADKADADKGGRRQGGWRGRRADVNQKKRKFRKLVIQDGAAAAVAGG